MSDADVVWRADPTHYLQCPEMAVEAERASAQLPCASIAAADVMVSSDNLSPKTDAKQGALYARGGVFNTGVVFLKTTPGAKAFAKALHKMLGDAPQLIRLDAEEGCVVIPSPTALEGILGKYYRHSKYASFQRQLNNFGFHRQAGAGVTIYRRSPEAGGRIDSVDAILGIRHVVRRKAAAPRPKAQLGDRYSAVSALLALKQSVAVMA